MYLNKLKRIWSLLNTMFNLEHFLPLSSLQQILVQLAQLIIRAKVGDENEQLQWTLTIQIRDEMPDDIEKRVAVDECRMDEVNEVNEARVQDAMSYDQSVRVDN